MTPAAQQLQTALNKLQKTHRWSEKIKNTLGFFNFSSATFSVATLSAAMVYLWAAMRDAGDVTHGYDNGETSGELIGYSLLLRFLTGLADGAIYKGDHTLRFRDLDLKLQQEINTALENNQLNIKLDPVKPVDLLIAEISRQPLLNNENDDDDDDDSNCDEIVLHQIITYVSFIIFAGGAAIAIINDISNKTEGAMATGLTGMLWEALYWTGNKLRDIGEDLAITPPRCSNITHALKNFYANTITTPFSSQPILNSNVEDEEKIEEGKGAVPLMRLTHSNT